jgi:hypothetical protein
MVNRAACLYNVQFKPAIHENERQVCLFFSIFLNLQYHEET